MDVFKTGGTGYCFQKDKEKKKQKERRKLMTMGSCRSGEVGLDRITDVVDLAAVLDPILPLSQRESKKKFRRLFFSFIHSLRIL